MTSVDEHWISVSRFLGHEAALLDARDWDAWIDLYTEDAEYWVPAWDDDGELTTDPQREISLIYYANRGGLEDRVFRIRTKRSASANQAPRTCHITQLMRVESLAGRLRARASWTVHSFVRNSTITYYGWSEYELIPHGGSWRIAKRKSAVLNDIADTMLDFYMI